MNNKYSVCFSLSQHLFMGRSLMCIKDIVTGELSHKFVSIIRDKINPIIIDSGFGSMSFKQDLYIFTEAELKEYIKQ